MRVKITTTLASARVALHVDVNFGDPIWPAPTEAELPLLLGGTLRLRGYPDHMVLTEKILTAIERGEANTRWRDFVDISAITGIRSIRYDDLRPALEAVATHRRIEIEPLAPLLADMPDLAQRRWGAWRRKQRLETTPELFGDLLEGAAFTEPALDTTAEGHIWDPSTKMWSSVDLDAQ